MHSRTLAGFVAAALLVISPTATAAVTDVQPRSVRPGEATRLTFTGKGLDASLRAVSNRPDVSLQVESAEAEKAIVVLTLPENSPLGPLGIWTSTATESSPPMLLLVDDLPTVADAGNNHSPETAQAIATLTAVDGVSDGAASDFYKITVTAGQRVAIEVLTQTLESKMDPLLHVLDMAGNRLQSADDDSVGPDCRCSFTFETAGEYLLEVGENSYTAGGRYHLRVGDFPLLQHAFPLAVQSGQSSTLQFATSDGIPAAATEVAFPAPAAGTSTNVAARIPEGQSSAWVPLQIRGTAQFVEPDTAASPEAAATPPTLTFPIGISGRLTAPQQTDQYTVQGVTGVALRIQSRTRSLGCATLLKMQLFNAAGAVVAETKVTNSDEWSVDYTFPDDGLYKLQVTDLLGRGGQGFGYWIDLKPAGTFAIALKPDAKTSESFSLEPTHGATAIDLQVQRFGYDGAIDLSLSPAAPGLHILNPQIPAKATEAKIYITADDTWTPDRLSLVSLLGQAADHPENQSRLDSLALHRIKTPHVPFPDGWNDGLVQLSGFPASDAYAVLESPAPLLFAKPLNSFAGTLQLKRINAEFKAAVTILPHALPGGWNIAVKADKDAYAATFTRSGEASEAVSQLPLLVYSEFQGRTRIDRVNLPVEWFDPLSVQLESSQPLIAGQKTKRTIKVQRLGDDPQTVTITWSNLPPGITAPNPLTIAGDQDQIEFELDVATDVTAAQNLSLEFQAASKYQGTDFTIPGRSDALTVVAAPQQIEVHPTELSFSDIKDRQQLVVTGIDANQALRDWSQDVTLTSANPEIAELRGTVVYPKANGETVITVQSGAHSQTIPVQVSGLETQRRTDFESEVLVALSQAGCNAGACHGSPSGKGMFRLSLRAFDMKLDELTLIREDFGRRLNRLDAEQSLLLLKPTMKVAHGGGKQLREQDPAYAILKNWIAEGAQPDPADTPRCVRLEVFPSEKRVLTLGSGGQQLAVTAHFADGSQRDVTHLVAYETSNTSVATVDASGLVSSQGRGEAVILVRFLEHIESVPVMFVEQVQGFQWAAPEPQNYIDELVNAKLQQLQYLPSDTCSDAEFVRRVYLDVVGILPTVAESQAFLDSPAENKRAVLIDELLERDEYAKFWALKWGDLLKMTRKLVGDEGVYKYHRWVEDSLRTNQPYDEFARELLTAGGSTLSNPPANFYRTATDMNECVETISQVFLGARIQCAKCHNHPFERWTQDNYYGLGAFFNRLERRNTQRPGEMFIWTSTTGDVTQPRTGEKMLPWLPQQGSVEIANDLDRRHKFAEWLVDEQNPYFARIEANRIWSQLFARGIVDPVDDFRDSNPPANGPLLDAMAEDFVTHGFDRKHLLRTILNSKTYQAGFQANAFNQDDTTYFSHQTPRLLSAEQLLDALNHITGLPQTLGNLPAGTKATHLPAPDLVKVEFLKVFGQPERSTVCACERSEDSNLGMAIELFNGTTIHAKLRDPNNRFRRALAAGQSLEQALDELYRAAVCRPPSDAERAAALAHCKTREDAAAGLEDVCWALLNTDEFLFQH